MVPVCLFRQLCKHSICLSLVSSVNISNPSHCKYYYNSAQSSRRYSSNSNLLSVIHRIQGLGHREPHIKVQGDMNALFIVCRWLALQKIDLFSLIYIITLSVEHSNWGELLYHAQTSQRRGKRLHMAQIFQ